MCTVVYVGDAIALWKIMRASAIGKDSIVGYVGITSQIITIGRTIWTAVNATRIRHWRAKLEVLQGSMPVLMLLEDPTVRQQVHL